jgi:hypothetical protein
MRVPAEALARLRRARRASRSFSIEDAALVLVMPHLAKNLGQLLVGLGPEVLAPSFRRLAGQPVEPVVRAPTTLPRNAP